MAVVENFTSSALCFQDVLIQFLTADEIQLNAIDAEDPEVRNYSTELLINMYMYGTA